MRRIHLYFSLDYLFINQFYNTTYFINRFQMKKNTEKVIAKDSTSHIRLTNGKATFTSTGKKSLELPKEILTTLSNQIQCIYFGLYKTENWKLTFQQVGDSYSQNTPFTYNGNPHIYQQIQHVDFRILVHLDLRDTRIQNIETLTMVNFNSLKQLDLGLDQNHINRITCFKKLSSTSLQSLSLSQNPICETLSLAKLKIINLKKLTLEKDRKSRVIWEDLSLISRVNIANFRQKITVVQEKRINQLKIDDMLKLLIKNGQFDLIDNLRIRRRLDLF